VLRVVTLSCLPGTGGTGCPLCAAGTYSSGLPAQASTCQACPAGTWSATTGATQCTPCLSGTYSTTVGASASSVCLPCAGGRWSTIGSTACVPLDRTKVDGVMITFSCLFPAHSYSRYCSSRPRSVNLLPFQYIISTLAGIPGASGSSGDGGPAGLAPLGFAAAVAVSASGDVYVSDYGTYKVRGHQTVRVSCS